MKALWERWIAGQAPSERDKQPPFLAKLFVRTLADEIKRRGRGHLVQMSAPTYQTVQGWIGERDQTVVQGRFQSGVLWMFFGANQDCSVALELKRAWESDREPGASAGSSSLPWLPDGSMQIGDKRKRLAHLVIHPSGPTDFTDRPSLTVTLTGGWFSDWIDVDGLKIRFRMAVRRLEIEHDFKNARPVPGTIFGSESVPYNVRWRVEVKSGDNKPQIDGETLAVLQIIRQPSEIKLIVYCNRNDFDTRILSPDGLDNMLLRVLERNIEVWGFDPGAEEVLLAEDRLLPPGAAE